MKSKDIKRIEEKTAILFYQIIRKEGNNKLTTKKFIGEWRCYWNKDFECFRQDENSYDEEAMKNFFTPIFDKYYEKWGYLDKKSMHDIRSKFLTIERTPIQVNKIANWRGASVIKYKGACMGYHLGGFCIIDDDDKKVAAGKDFELSIDEVCKFLGIKVDDSAQFKYIDIKGQGYYNWKGIKANIKVKSNNKAKPNNKKKNKPKPKGAK